MFYEYDGQNDICPFPLVKTRQLLKKMQHGDSCMILIKDKGSKKNIISYLNKYSWQYSQKQLDQYTIAINITK